MRQGSLRRRIPAIVQAATPMNRKRAEEDVGHLTAKHRE